MNDQELAIHLAGLAREIEVLEELAAAPERLVAGEQKWIRERIRTLRLESEAVHGERTSIREEIVRQASIETLRKTELTVRRLPYTRVRGADLVERRVLLRLLRELRENMERGNKE